MGLEQSWLEDWGTLGIISIYRWQTKFKEVAEIVQKVQMAKVRALKNTKAYLKSQAGKQEIGMEWPNIQEEECWEAGVTEAKQGELSKERPIPINSANLKFHSIL